MWDLLEIEITDQRTIRLLAKTIARHPGFFVHDYMAGITGAYPTIENRAITMEDLVQATSTIRPEFDNLSAQCIIVENRADGLGIPVGTFTLIAPAGLSEVVGWRETHDGRHNLTMRLNDRWFDFPPDAPNG